MTDVDQKLQFVDTDQTEASSSAAVPSGANKFWEVELDYPFDDARVINSYLRIGTFEDNPALQTDANGDPIAADSASSVENALFHRGHDLAAMIVDFYDDTRDRGEVPAPGDSPDPRDPFFTDPAERKAESALLHTKGGWRDHSDGNRISTTRGDKLEVIRGNYQMVVLGRQDERANQSRYEAGGGHFSRDNDNLTPGAIFKISWVREPFSGTWRVIEETTKGDYLVRYHGDVEEEYFGDSIKKTVGSETIGTKIVDWESAPDPTVKTANPTIKETTFAKEIDARVGSSTQRVPAIRETTFANDYTEIDFGRLETVEHDYSDGDITIATYSNGTIKEERRGDYVGRFDGNSNEFWGMFIRPPPDDDDTPDGFKHSAVGSNFLEVFIGASETFKLGFFTEAISPLLLKATIGANFDFILGTMLVFNVGWEQKYWVVKDEKTIISQTTTMTKTGFCLFRGSMVAQSHTG